MREQTDYLEEKIRIKTESLRIRLNEYFIDYDRLRSGFITLNQFKRVLDQILRGALNSEEIEQVGRKYDLKNNNQVNYRQFCNVINRTFPENNLNDNPENHVYKNPEYLGTLRSMKKLDDELENELKQLLSQMSEYYSKKNIDVLTFFRDFDKNKNGLVSVSQFKRSLTEPPIDDNQFSLLVKKYQHPEVKDTVSYLNFFNDVSSTQKSKGNSFNQFRNLSEFSIERGGFSIQEIMDKISIACHKEGIRIGDFFKDYDKLRSGVITDRQFATALTYGVQKQANLSNDEISQLTEYYRRNDGRCEYKPFMDTVENVFNIPDMEKKPLAKVTRPPNGLLAKTLNGNLTPAEEDVVARALETISDKVRKYKLTLFTYFKDFDRSTAYTKNVSKIQFGRVLLTLNLMPSNNEYELICKKFEDPVTGDVNYPIFCQAVEEDFVACKIEDISYDNMNGKLKELDKQALDFPPDTTNVDMNDVMARIRAHVLGKKLRIKEFFQDMDPLNSGTITKSQFIRCLSSIGISSLGALQLSKAETIVLCNQYEQGKEKVNWKKFEEDLESVFTLRNLEKNPNQLVPNPHVFILPPPGTVKWNDETQLDSSENYKIIVENLQKIASQRRLDVWPPFKDYDKLNHGHVTRQQFHQCLAILNLHVSDKDKAILEAKYLNNLGFNYLEFLNLLQPNKVEPRKYQDLMNELKKLNYQKDQYEANPLRDLRSILNKIKDQVFKRRVSIYEWLKDHDKLNSGRIPKETFRRAFNLCNLDVEKSEVDLLINHYNSIKDEKAVEYRDFCREVETAFGSDQYEKNPLLDPEQHVANNHIESNYLTPDENDMLIAAMERLAQRVKKERIDLFPLFEDFDRVKNGFVTQSQFRRVLNTLNLVSMLKDIELDCIMKKYHVKIGTRDDVNYIAFSDKIYELGSFEYRKP